MTAKRWLLNIICLALVFAPAGLRAADWLEEWQFRQELTIDGSQIEADLTNFPVLVRLTRDNFDFDMAAPGGRDIRFAAADGVAPLSFERELHDTSGQSAAYWVRLPLASAASNTIFYLYCGNRAAVDTAAPAEVWDEGHLGVWHLNQTNGVTQADATAAGNQLTVGPAGLDLGDVPISDCDDLAGWAITGSNSTLAVSTTKSDTVGGSTTSIGMTVTETAAGQTNTLTYQPGVPLVLGRRRLDFFALTTKAFNTANFLAARVYIYDTAGNYRYHDLATGVSIGDMRGYDIISKGTTGGTAPDLNSIERIEWVLVSANNTPHTLYIDSLNANGALDEGSPAVVGGGVTLSGQDHYLISKQLLIDTTNGLSLSAWVRPHDTSVYWRHFLGIVSMGGGNWYQYDSTRLFYYSGQKVGAYSSASKSTHPDGTSIEGSGYGMTVGAWHHATTVFHHDAATSNSTMKVYLDGELLVDQSLPGRVMRALINKPICVGAINQDSYPSNDPVQNFHGGLDEVRVSNVARSGAWIKASYHNQKAGGTLLRLAPLESRAAWLPGWRRRQRLTLNPEAVGADLTNFPVLVRLTADNFDFGRADPDGIDIRFMAGDGRFFLDFERESHDIATQTAAYWVRIPLVSSTVPTSFLLYYGKHNAGDGAKPAAVWDGTHASVWHLNHTNGVTQSDSTATGLHLAIGPAGLDHGDVDISDCDTTTDWFVTGESATLSLDTATRDTVVGSPSSVRATISVTTTGQVNALVFNPATPLALGNRRLDFYLYASKAMNTAFKSIRVYLYDADGNYRYHDFANGSGDDQAKGFGIAVGGKTDGTAPDIDNIDRIEWVMESANNTPYSFYVDSVLANGAMEEGTDAVVGQGVTLSGNDHYLISEPTNINTTNGLTISAWILPRKYTFYSSRSYQGIVDVGGGNFGPYYQTLLGYYKLQKIHGLTSVSSKYDPDYSGGVAISGTATGVTTGRWHHVAGVYHYDAVNMKSSLKLYVDGVKQLDTTIDGRALRTLLDKRVCVGGVTWSPYPSNDPIYQFNGDMDEVRISNVTRSDAWLEASFLNQQADDALLIFGHVEPPPGTLLLLR